MSKFAKRILTKKKRRIRRDANEKAVMAICSRACQGGPAEYLTTNQEPNEARIVQLKQFSQERQQRRNLVRLRNHKGSK